MSTSILRFAVADENGERLARLAEHFGGRDRSAYLRATLSVKGVAAPGGADARTAGPQCRAIMVRRVPDADLTTTSQWPLLVAAQEEDMASLEVAGLVEKSDEGAGDGGREAAVLGKGFGGDEDEASACCPAARYWASRGMKSLMLAVTRARPAVVA
jgi:hypothetical protein